MDRPFHPKPENPWFGVKPTSYIGQFFVETCLFFYDGVKPPRAKWPDGRVLDIRFLVKNRFTMVSTSRIEVLGVKPDLHFSFVINSFHNDLFSQGIQRGFLYFRKRHSCIRQEAPRKHPGGTQEAPRKHPAGSQEAPKGTQRHPGDTQEVRGLWDT